MKKNKIKGPTFSFIQTIIVGLVAAGFAVIALLGILEILPTWCYAFVIPSILLVFIQVKLGSKVSIAGTNKTREILIKGKVINKKDPGFEFLMKKSDKFDRGNYYLAATEKGLLFIKFGNSNKVYENINYNNIKSFKMQKKRRNTLFEIELKNGKTYNLYKNETTKLLLKLNSFINFIHILDNNIEIEGFR